VWGGERDGECDTDGDTDEHAGGDTDGDTDGDMDEHASGDDDGDGDHYEDGDAGCGVTGARGDGAGQGML